MANGIPVSETTLNSRVAHLQSNEQTNKQTNVVGRSNNIQKLTDEDRAGWLLSMQKAVNAVDASKTVVLACSALKKKYRHVLRHGGPRKTVFVHLVASRETVTERVARRTDHYMPTSLIASQFETLETAVPTEEPDCVSVVIDGKTREQVLNDVLEQVRPRIE
jgi:gluconokinase